MNEFKVLDYVALDAELRNCTVALIDPSENATTRINKRLIKIQGYKDRVLGMMYDAINNKNLVEKKYNEMSFEIERAKESLMINDDDIKELAQKKAEAAVNLKLKDKLADMLLMENILADAKAFERRTVLGYENLEATYKSISKLIGNINVLIMKGEMKMPNGAGRLKIGED